MCSFFVLNSQLLEWQTAALTTYPLVNSLAEMSIPKKSIYRYNALHPATRLNAYHCIESRRIFRTPNFPRSTGSRPSRAMACHRRGLGVGALYHMTYCRFPMTTKLPSRRGLQKTTTLLLFIRNFIVRIALQHFFSSATMN